MQCVARRISDGKMLHLIKMWLKAPVEETDERGHRRMSGGKKATRGTPQGGVASPLMANIYMHRFIKAFRKYGLDRRYGAVLVTYADDFVVLCRHGAAEVLDDDSAMDDQHRARAERGPRRVCATPDASPSTSSATPSARCTRREPADAITVRGLRRRPSPPSRTRIRRRLRPGNHAPWDGSGARPEPHGAGMGGLLQLRFGDEGAARGETARCITRSVAFFAAGTRSPGLATGSFPSKRCLGRWASCPRNPVPASLGRPRACLDVKPVRELGAGNPHAQFDEREGETERWTSRRARQRKTPRALGAAGPARHRASPRLTRRASRKKRRYRPLGSRYRGIHSHGMVSSSYTPELQARGLTTPPGLDVTSLPSQPEALRRLNVNTRRLGWCSRRYHRGRPSSPTHMDRVTPTNVKA